LLIEVAAKESPVGLAEVLRHALAATDRAAGAALSGSTAAGTGWGPVAAPAESPDTPPDPPGIPGPASVPGPLAPVRDVVPGATTVLVECASAADLERVRSVLATLPLQLEDAVVAAGTLAIGTIGPGTLGDGQGGSPAHAGVSGPGGKARAASRRRTAASGLADAVVLDVIYDGPDLADVAARLGVTPDEVADLHCSAPYTVAFCGFAPGFAYLRGTPEALCLPRLATPRTDVPAGSVAVAGGWSAVYPRSGPGGWILLGRTERTLFDVDADPPALLAPGRHVVFRRIG
jgi:hypothetical protein